MKFIDNITADMHSSMKSGDKVKTKVLRVLLAKLKEYQINHRKELTEKECISVIKTSVKQGNEAADIYEKANRLDLAEKEKEEINILNNYLPKMMTEDEIRKLVQKVVGDVGVKSISEIGRVMPLIIQSGDGKIDGKLANQILREILD